MSWAVAGFPRFIAEDAAALMAELIAFELSAIRRDVADEDAYSELYADIFGARDLVEFVYAPAAVVAAAGVRFIRTIGTEIMVDDTAALSHLREHVRYATRLAPVRMARPGVYTRTRAQQLANRTAFVALVHRAGALAWAERLPELDLGPVAQANSLRAAASEIFATVIDETPTGAGTVVRMLRQVFASALQLINRRAINAREDEFMLLARAMPSLVCAHWAWREARQAQRIRDSNPAAHPNFMPLQLAVPQWP